MPAGRTEAGITTGFNHSDDLDKRIAQSVSDGYRSARDPATDRRLVNLQYHHGALLGQNFYLQANHTFDLEDDADRKIDGNTTLDLALSRQTDFGKFSLGVQNLLDESYSTVWGQRAAMFYSPYYGPEYLYDYQGREYLHPDLVDGLLTVSFIALMLARLAPTFVMGVFSCPQTTHLSQADTFRALTTIS